MNDKNVNAILGGLDSRQAEAVRCTEGPVLIVAGAGSGKTRVLTSRIAYLLEQGTDPERILALTFTKKAATEMKDRIAAMVGERKARRLRMGTFHSVLIRFLREYADWLGYPASFTIYDTTDSVSAIRRIIKEMQLDDKVYKPKDVLSRISMAKNNLTTVQAYRNNPEALKNDSAAKKPKIVDIYAAYQNLMKQAGVMDFDDILLNMNILLQYNAKALEELSARFSYLLVDEYQDTNFAQYLILRKLAQPHRNLCVVGDDSQSIYAFRGARIENILRFQKDYPGCHIFRLEQNYRSTRNIVDAANSVIARNRGRIPKECFSLGEEGDKIRLIQAYTEGEEALLIASSIISRMQAEHAAYRDFAILYRTNSQSRALEEALRKRNLPYRIYSGNSFFERAEVKDMMAYLKLAVNPADDESFRRVVNTPARGIGDTTLEALSAAAKAAQRPLMETLAREDLDAFGLRNAAITKLRAFAQMMQTFHAKAEKEDAWQVAAGLSDACGLYQSYKADNSIESQSRAANIEELINSVKTFVEGRHNDYVEDLMAEGQLEDGTQISENDLPVVTLGEFLEDISLLSAVDVAEEGEDASNKISLMTVHAAKGLEFPFVFVAGMEENLFPSGGILATPSDIEEERRLFYVALTRAQKAIGLTFATTRMRNGKHESNEPSRFLREVDPRYVANPLPVDEGFGPGFGSGLRGMSPGVAKKDSPLSRYGASSPARSFPPRGEKRPAAPVQQPSRSFTPVRKPSAAPAREDPSFVPVSVLDLRVGQRIENNRFGQGTILEFTGEGADMKATIDFSMYGRKVILLKYAKIRLCEK